MNTPTMIALLLLGAFAVFVAYCAMRQRGMASIRVEVVRRQVAGGIMRGTATVTARRDLQIASIDAELACHAANPRQQNLPGDEHSLHLDRHRLTGPMTLARGQGHVLSFSMPVPADAPGLVNAGEKRGMQAPVWAARIAVTTADGTVLRGGETIVLERR